MSLDNLDGQITPNDLIDLGIATRDSNGRLSSGGVVSAPVGDDIVFSTAASGSLLERGRIAADGTITGLAAAANVLSISELPTTVFYVSGINAPTTFNMGLLVAMFAAKFAALSLATAEAHAQSDTDYWTFTLTKEPGSHVIATKSTKLTGGFPITQWSGWNFDAVTFDATYQQLAKDEYVRLKIASTGAPAAITGLTVSYRIEPV